VTYSNTASELKACLKQWAEKIKSRSLLTGQVIAMSIDPLCNPDQKAVFSHLSKSLRSMETAKEDFEAWLTKETINETITLELEWEEIKAEEAKPEDTSTEPM
jgi:hypothetical protein